MLFNQLSPFYSELFNSLKADFLALDDLLKEERVLIPKYENILRAFASDSPPKVVILGQDPYPNPTHACGLAFSTPASLEISKLPASLKNIFKELTLDTGLSYPKSGDLTPWVSQGVLLLNTRLTLTKDLTINKSWDELINKILTLIKQSNPEVIMLCWGAPAFKIASTLEFKNIISSPHPSPLSSYRGFFDSRPFTKINATLNSIGEKPVNWSL